jgi:hypothetical protein
LQWAVETFERIFNRSFTWRFTRGAALPLQRMSQKNVSVEKVWQLNLANGLIV